MHRSDVFKLRFLHQSLSFLVEMSQDSNESLSTITLEDCAPGIIRAGTHLSIWSGTAVLERWGSDLCKQMYIGVSSLLQ